MNKRFAAAATALLAGAPLAAVAVTASPAQALGRCDDSYPPGRAYGLRISPSYLVVRPGTTIELSTRLVRGNEECNGERVGWYTRGRGKLVFNLSRTGSANGRGLNTQRYVVRDDFRYFTDFVQGNIRKAKSPGGLVQARRGR